MGHPKFSMVVNFTKTKLVLFFCKLYWTKFTFMNLFTIV
jgi:hypothetical protein